MRSPPIISEESCCDGGKGLLSEVMPDHIPEPDQKGVVELLGAGSEVAGGVAGAAIGVMAAGPVGGLIGGGVGPIVAYALKKLGNEIHRRLLSPREQQRIGGVIAYAVQRIKEKLDAGEQVRSDGFFASDANSRAPAEEIYEGIILAAQREHEEKKLPFMGNLMANLAFHPEIDRGYANFLVRLAENLSYRQLCLLFVFALNDKSGLRQTSYRGITSFAPLLLGILQEAMELSQWDMIGSGEANLGFYDIAPGKTATQAAGAHLFNLMELIRLPISDVQALASILA